MCSARLIFPTNATTALPRSSAHAAADAEASVKHRAAGPDGAVSAADASTDAVAGVKHRSRGSVGIAISAAALTVAAALMGAMGSFGPAGGSSS
jgi:hypothetical protein